MEAGSRAAPAALAPSSSYALDAGSRRVLRFALGTTLASVAFLTGFGLPFLVPILAAMLLTTTKPVPSFRAGVQFVAIIAVAALAGLLITRLLVNRPSIFLLGAFLILFRLYFALYSGAAPFLVVWLIIASLLIPLIGLTSMALAIGIAKGLTVGAGIAIVSVWIAYGLLPDVPDPTAARGDPGASGTAEAKPLPPLEVRFRLAITSTAVLFPVLVVIFSFNYTGGALILIFIALLSLQPSFAAGWKMGKGLIYGNVIGGIVAIVFFEILVALPEFAFFLLLLLLVGLVFGRVMFSDNAVAPLFKTGFNTVILLVGMSVMVSGAEASSKFYVRIAQIMVAVFYVVAAFGLIEHVQKRLRES